MLNPARRGQREQGGAPNICVFAASTKTSTQRRRWRFLHSATSPAWAFPVAGSMPAVSFCSTHTHTDTHAHRAWPACGAARGKRHSHIGRVGSCLVSFWVAWFCVFFLCFCLFF